MGNLIRNAGLLDGVTDWAATAGAALTVDESVIGAPGRAVLAATKTLAIGAQVASWSAGAPVNAGDPLEVMALVGNSEALAPTVALQIVDSIGSPLATTAIGFRRAAAAPCRRGLPLRFHDAYGKVAAPASGWARIIATSTATVAGVHKLYLLKPYIGAPVGFPARWDPGAHTNPDLQLPVWPAELPRFRGQPTVEPFSNLKPFAGDVGLPGNARTYDGLHHMLRGQMRLTMDQADTLDQFYAAGAPQFYMVRPDTDELCFAEWLADGAPKLAEQRGPYVFRDVGFHIWPA